VKASPGSLVIKPFGDANRHQVLSLATHAWDRSRSASTLAWRYEQCPTLEGAVALDGEDCVACVFAMRRTYWSPSGDVECLEPFDWYATDEWRPKGAGLRVMKHLMAGSAPLVAMGGSHEGRRLLGRLGWKHAWTATCVVLPLSGRFLRYRGRSRVVSLGFDLVGRPLYAPPRHPEGRLRVEPAGSPGQALDAIIKGQSRFGFVPRTDDATLRWLRDAPAEFGLYLGFNFIVDGAMVGWARARVLTATGIRIADLQDLILSTEALAFYPEAVNRVTAILASFGPDAIFATTTCPDTLAALRRRHFRPDHMVPVYVWWPGGAPPATALVTRSHGEHAFFPTPTAAESAWAGQ